MTACYAGVMRCRPTSIETWKHVWCLLTKLNKPSALDWISWYAFGLWTLFHLSFIFFGRTLQRGSWINLRFKGRCSVFNPTVREERRSFSDSVVKVWHNEAPGVLFVLYAVQIMMWHISQSIQTQKDNVCQAWVPWILETQCQACICGVADQTWTC